MNGGGVVSTGDVPTTVDVGRRAVGLVRDRLPGTWKATPVIASPDAAQPDAVLEVAAPDGRVTRLVFEVKQVVERRDVPRLAAQASLTARRTNEVMVVAARYLSASVRDALDTQGLSYADATGNLRVVVDSPAMFVSDRGQDRDPWRQGRPRGTLKGDPAARVARALLDVDRDWTVRELVAASGASTGAAYRVLDYLEREDLVVKEGTRYRVTDWERLLRAWSADAAFTTTTRVTTFIEPRGLDAFLTKVARDQAPSAVVTGSVAAAQWATYAPAKAVYVYVASAQDASERWALRTNTAAPNVVLLEPTTVGDVPFRNALPTTAGYRVAAPAQVAADLLNGPGREPAEGEHLIEWMKANEQEWRRGR